MSALIAAIGTVATWITILVFLTGILICRNIYRVGSTADFSSFPFLAGVLRSFLWVRFGHLTGNENILFLNNIGLTLQSVYLSWFYLFTKDKSQINRHLGYLALSLGAAHLYSNYAPQPEALIGLIASLATMVVYAAPLARVPEVFRTKSTEKLSFALVLAALVMSGLWTLYGYLLSNVYLLVPHGFGAVCCTLQFALFGIYPAKSSAATGQKGGQKSGEKGGQKGKQNNGNKKPSQNVNSKVNNKKSETTNSQKKQKNQKKSAKLKSQ